MKSCENIENKNNLKNTNNNNQMNENNLEEQKDTQFYLITLEDSNGEHQQIRIFKNSDPIEIAFNFCKENNLDFKSMKYIKKNIEKIIKQFDEPNHKLCFLDNSYSSIQELEEENFGSENTFKSKYSVINESNNYKDKKSIGKNINNIQEKNIVIINDNNGNCGESIKSSNIEKNKNEENFDYNADLNSKNELTNIEINKKNNLNINITKEKNIKKENDKNIIVNNNIDDGINNKLNEENKLNKSFRNKNSIDFNDNNSIIEDNLNINLSNKNNILENNNLNELKGKSTTYQSQIKNKEKINNNETLKQDNKGLNRNILVKKIKKHNSKVNFIKLNTNVSSLYHKENSIKINQNIYVKSKIQKLFRCINPKQHLINEEYKIIKKKELNRENNNRADKNDNIMNKTQKISQKLKEKLSEKNEKNFRKSITFISDCNSDLNLKKKKRHDNYNVSNLNNDNNIDLMKINKNKSILESFPSLKNKDKSSSKKSNDLYPKESGSKKKTEKINYNKNTYTPSNLFLKINKNSNSNLTTTLNNPNKNNYSKIKEKQASRNDILDKLKSYTSISNYPKTINKSNLINQNSFIQNQEKLLLKNKSDNKIKRKNKNNVCSKKKNYINHKINIEKKNGALEESQSKSKKISEMKNGLSKIFNNFQDSNNILLNTNYIINKRYRIINSKDKNNMSMNLSRHIHDYNKKTRESPKYKLETKISNNNFLNLTIKDNHVNSNYKTIYNKFNKINNNNNYINNNKDSIYDNPNYKYDIMTNKKIKFYNKLINTHRLNQSIPQKYNTNINNKSRILSSISSNNEIKKKIIFEKKGNITKNNSFFNRKKNRSSRNKEISNSLNISNSLLTTHDKNNKFSDYCLKILGQYYTINNTINITNNNSLLNGFSNNKHITFKKHYIIENNSKINCIKYLFNNLFQFFDKENNGFFIMNYKLKINEIFNNMRINLESKKIFEKMIKILFEINKNNKSLEIGKDKIIINKNIFMKHMIYIFNNKLNTNEKNILSETKREIDKFIKKHFILYHFKPKSSFNELKSNSDYLSSNISCKRNKLKENTFIYTDIKAYDQKKEKKSSSQQKPKYKSFNEL